MTTSEVVKLSAFCEATKPQMLVERPSIRPASKDKAVWEDYGGLLAMPGHDTRLELERSRTTNTYWAMRRLHALQIGAPAWRFKVIVDQ